MSLRSCGLLAEVTWCEGGGPRAATWYDIKMVKTLEIAIEKLAGLSEADQEQIGQRLLSHVEKLRLLRVEIDNGIRSLDAGEGKPLDIEDFIKQSNAGNGRR